MYKQIRHIMQTVRHLCDSTLSSPTRSNDRQSVIEPPRFRMNVELDVENRLRLGSRRTGLSAGWNIRPACSNDIRYCIRKGWSDRHIHCSLSYLIFSFRFVNATMLSVEVHLIRGFGELGTLRYCVLVAQGHSRQAAAPSFPSLPRFPTGKFIGQSKNHTSS